LFGQSLIITVRSATICIHMSMCCVESTNVGNGSVRVVSRFWNSRQYWTICASVSPGFSFAISSVAYDQRSADASRW
jgi:hypothetical protein